MDTQSELHEVRKHIDEVDLRILLLLGKRSELVKEIGKIKALAKIDTYQKTRFEELLSKLKTEASKMGLDEVLVDDVWNAIHKSSIQQQNTANDS